MEPQTGPHPGPPAFDEHLTGTPRIPHPIDLLWVAIVVWLAWSTSSPSGAHVDATPDAG